MDDYIHRNRTSIHLQKRSKGDVKYTQSTIIHNRLYVIQVEVSGATWKQHKATIAAVESAGCIPAKNISPLIDSNTFIVVSVREIDANSICVSFKVDSKSTVEDFQNSN